MRVVAGEARSVPLVTPSGKDTRPTSDRIKETLFNILQNDIPGCRFLDLFSGSGGIGIEAISRGAKHCTFVDLAREPIKCIQANLEKTKFTDRATVLPMEVTYGIAKLSRQGEPFDIVFADPPYPKEFESKILNLLGESEILRKDTLVIIETPINRPVDYVDENVYEIEKIKDYKTNRHVFLRRK